MALRITTVLVCLIAHGTFTPAEAQKGRQVRATWRTHNQHMKTLRKWDRKLAAAAERTFAWYAKLDKRALNKYRGALKSERKALVKEIRSYGRVAVEAKEILAKRNEANLKISNIDRVLAGLGSWIGKGASRAKATVLASQLEYDKAIATRRPKALRRKLTQDQHELLSAMNDISRLQDQAGMASSTMVMGVISTWASVPFIGAMMGNAAATGSLDPYIAVIALGVTAAGAIGGKTMTTTGTHQMRDVNALHHDANTYWKSERSASLKRLGVDLE